MQQPKYSWDEYFTGSPSQFVGYQYTTRQTRSEQSVYVLNCLFNKISASSGGSALYCTSVTHLLIESTSFFTCKTSTGNGGAIYFSNTNDGQCVLHEVCGYACGTEGSYGLFAYIQVNDSILCKNHINYSSVARCTFEVSNSYRTLHLYNGKICCPSVNISMNKCYYRSGLLLWPSYESNTVTCSLLYSTFADNTATNYNCIYFWRSSAEYEIKYCNIIRNKQVSLSSWATIRSNGNLLIENSCILENEATNNFYAESTCTITLSKCTVDRTTSTGKLVVQNTAAKSFILGLKHMSTLNCNAGYDSAGTLTAIPTECPTNEVIYQKCKTNNRQIRISEVLLVNCIFMITFVLQTSF
jgi:hypothetical protein